MTHIKMKIGFLAPDDLSTIIFCERFAEALGSMAGIEMVTVGQVGLYREEIKRLGCRHVDLPMTRFLHPVRDLRYFWQVFQLTRREKFDALLTFTTKPNTIGLLAAAMGGVPLTIMAVRGLGRAFGSGTSVRERFSRIAVRALYRMAARHCEFVWFTNRNDRAYFVSEGLVDDSRTLLTPNAVHVGSWSMDRVDPVRLADLRAELRLREGDRVVIMVARLIWSKGIREFAEVAVRLRDSHPDVRFLLVAPSEGASAGAIPEAWVRDIESRSNLQWLAFRKDVKDLYALSDLAVLPSWYKEGGYPRALLEPMALGKAVIAADTDDCRGPVAHGVNGLLVTPRDSGALANAILAILCDDTMRAHFGRCSLQRVRDEFDDRVVVKSVLARIGLTWAG